MKKITAMTLLLAMALSAASCGAGGGTSGDQTTTAGGDTTTAAPEDTSPKLELPEKNFGGAEFTILSSDINSYEYDAEEQTGDIVEDAVYKRNRTVEELLGVDFNIVSQPGDWAAKDTFNGLIKNSILAGDGEYDLISGVAVIVMQLTTEGYFVNANTLNYIDFDKPWWVQGMNDNLAIEGKLYGFIGDASLSLYKDLSVLYFNKKILADYNLEDPYQYVYDDNWNIDTFGGMIKGVSSDLNSDGKLKWGEDMVGFMTNSVPNRAFMTATEISFLTYDDGVPKFGDLSERSDNVYEKLYKVFKENDNVLNNPKDEYDIATQYFTEDKALFMDAFLKYADNMRDMTSDFGIVPYPKADSQHAGKVPHADRNLDLHLLRPDHREGQGHDRDGLRGSRLLLDEGRHPELLRGRSEGKVHPRRRRQEYARDNPRRRSDGLHLRVLDAVRAVHELPHRVPHERRRQYHDLLREEPDKVAGDPRPDNRKILDA